MYTTLRSLDGKNSKGLDYILVLDSQDVNAILEYAGIECADITGCVVCIDEGDYIEIWLTECSAPYIPTALYHPVSFYATQDAYQDASLPFYTV